MSWLLLAPLPVAIFALGTVHAVPRALVTTLVLGISALLALQVRREHDGRRAEISAGQLALLGAGLVLCLGGALSLVPVSAALRAFLQPGFADAIGDLWQVAGLSADGHPLALHPAAGLLAVGQGAAALLFAAVCSTIVRTRRRALRMAQGIGVIALAVIALAWAQWATGATSVYWRTGLPEFARAPFFGPFIDPNHAGILLAVATPLALALGLREDGQGRWLWRLAVPLLVFATWTTTSRGAVLGMVIGLGVLVCLAARPAVALAAASLGGVALIAFVGAGPARVTALLTARLMPAAATPDPFGDRLALWQDGLRLAEAAPWVGVGAGSFGDGHWLVKQGVAYSAAIHAHNEAIQALAEHGLWMGAGWILLLLAPVAWGLRGVLALERGRRRTLGASFLAAAAAFLFGCTYEFPLRIGGLLLLYALLAGVLVGSIGEPPRVARAAGLRAWGLGLGFLLTLGLAAPAGVVLSALKPDHPYADTGPARIAAASAWEEAILSERPRIEAARSLEAARSVVDRRPVEMGGLMLVARGLRGAGDRDAANAFLAEAVRVLPASPHLWFWRARAARSEGDLAAAREAWRRGLALDLPADEDGASYVLEAIAAEDAPAAQVEAIIPRRADRLRDAGRILSRTGQPADAAAARDLFAAAIALDPNSRLPYATALLRWGEPAAAWEQIQALAGRGCAIDKVGAEALMDLQRYAEAADWFERASSACGSDDRGARVGLAKARAAAHLPGARKLLEALVAEEPDAHALRRLLVQVLREESVELSLLVPHVQALVDAGVATPLERENLDRLKVGLPPRGEVSP